MEKYWNFKSFLLLQAEKPWLFGKSTLNFNGKIGKLKMLFSFPRSVIFPSEKSNRFQSKNFRDSTPRIDVSNMKILKFFILYKKNIFTASKKRILTSQVRITEKLRKTQTGTESLSTAKTHYGQAASRAGTESNSLSREQATMMNSENIMKLIGFPWKREERWFVTFLPLADNENILILLLSSSTLGNNETLFSGFCLRKPKNLRKPLHRKKDPISG